VTVPEDWSALAQEWRRGEAGAEAPTVEHLRTRERSARRQSTLVWAGGLLLSAVIVAGSTRVLYWHRDVFGMVLVLPAWLLVAAVGRPLVLGRAGTEPRGEPATDFIAAAANQLRGRLKAIGTVVILVAAQAAVLLIWASARVLESRGAPLPPDAIAWIALGIGAALVLGWSLWYRRRVHDQLAEVEHLRAEVGRSD
jgi:hypothetical protein